jgi:hypothetical protein
MNDLQVAFLEREAQAMEGVAQVMEHRRPHRCATRLQDWVATLFHERQFAQVPERWRIMRQCYKSEVGEEPRVPHLNLPPPELPRWDPWHPAYDPNAPYLSFERHEAAARQGAAARARADQATRWAVDGTRLWRHPDAVALEELRQAKSTKDELQL